MNKHRSWSQQYHTRLVTARVLSLLSLLVAIFMAAYSARVFYLREKMIRRRSDGPFDDLLGPVAAGVVIIVALFVMFGSAVYAMVQAL
jgi:uncharacterized membrane protein YidH (DUF202 family)